MKTFKFILSVFGILLLVTALVLAFLFRPKWLYYGAIFAAVVLFAYFIYFVFRDGWHKTLWRWQPSRLAIIAIGIFLPTFLVIISSEVLVKSVTVLTQISLYAVPIVGGVYICVLVLRRYTMSKSKKEPHEWWIRPIFWCWSFILWWQSSSHPLWKERIVRLGKLFLTVLTVFFAHKYWEELTSWQPWIEPVLSISIGVYSTVLLAMLVALFYRSELTYNIKDPNNKAVIFLKAEPHRSKIKMLGGRPVGVIRGGEFPPIHWNLPWWVYEIIVYQTLGLRVIGLFYFQHIRSYDLEHRYRVVDSGNGLKDHVPITKEDDRFRSDHVRTQVATWPFRLGGAEVESVPFGFLGACQVYIEKGREIDASFRTDSWNLLLSTAVESCGRDLILSGLTIDYIIGAVGSLNDNLEETKVFDNSKFKEALYREVGKEYERRLLEYTVSDGKKAKTLRQLVGLVIARVDVMDFRTDLKGDDARALHKPARTVKTARARQIEGAGEAAYQSKTLPVLSEYPEIGKANLNAEALKEMARSGSIDSIIALFADFLMSKGGR